MSVAELCGPPKSERAECWAAVIGCLAPNELLGTVDDLLKSHGQHRQGTVG